jgi:hypothetical protein
VCPSCTLLAKADFEQFVWRDQNGVRFANRMRMDGRFRDRHWPAFQRARRMFRRRRPWMNTSCGEKVSRSIERSARIAAARRWVPANPLDAYRMRVEDAVR